MGASFCTESFPGYAQPFDYFRIKGATNSTMKLAKRIKEVGAMGYILLWLIGIPIPILFVIFLLRGCS